MKPHRLELRAFGPFADRAEVDFDRLAEVGLFVVAGPTGAGKTSVFDGLCYGLYGRLAGHREQHGEVRSDHADASVPTEVTLEFSAEGRRWRVWRHPRQQRPKRRGSGSTTAAPAATLHRLGVDGWEPVESRWDAVNQQCRRLVGLDAEQFQQVVLLPQGRFEEVLNARSSERQTLLRTLFQSEPYRHGQERMEAQARALEAAIGSVQQEVRAHLDAADRARLEAAASLAEEGLVDTAVLVPADEPRASGGVRASLDALRLPHQRLQVRRRRAEREAATTADTATRAEQVRSLVRRRTELRRRWAEVEDAAPAMARARERLERARRAEPVRDRWRTERDRARQLEVGERERDRAWDAATEACAGSGLELPIEPDDDRVEQCRLEAEMQVKLMDDLVTLLDEARQADDRTARCADEHRQLLDRRREVQHRQEATAVQLEALRGEEQQLMVVVSQGSARRARRDELRRRHDACRRLADIDAELSRVDERRSALCSQIEHLDGDITTVTTQRDVARRQSDRLAVLVPLVERRGRQLARSRAASAAAAELVDAEVALRRQRAEADEVFERFVAGSAPRLAAVLQPGAACPVCGSHDHPSPATATSVADFPDAGEVERRSREVAAAEARRSAAAATVAALRQELGDEADLAESDLQRSLDEAQADLRRCEIARRQVPTLDVQLQALEQQRLELDDQRGAAAGRVDELSASRHELRGFLGDDDPDVGAAAAALGEAQRQLDEVDQAQQRLRDLGEERLERQRAHDDDADLLQRLSSEAVRVEEQGRAAAEEATRKRRQVRAVAGDASPDDLLARARRGADALTDARRALATASEARRAWRSAAAELTAALQGSEFEGVEEALAALLPVDAVRRLTHEVEDHDRQRIEVRAGLDELSSYDLPDDEPDVEHLRNVADTAAARARQLVQLSGQVEARLSQGRQHCDHVAALEAEHGELHQRARTVRSAAEVVKGRNHRNTTLEAWVLAAHLRDVVDHANEHLTLMSGGRYRLAVSEAVADGRAKAGLDLVVDDAHTGRTRSTVTLSGGETFQASLSLALGLADVVMAGRAGLRLDALFIDEGFGSLDADALDQAIDVLDGLRSRGAMVGVVTHVESMKAALPVALEVRPRPDRAGSTVHQLR